MGPRRILSLVLVAAVGGGSLRALTLDPCVQQIFSMHMDDFAIQPAGSVPACVAPPSGLVSWWPMDGTGQDFQLINSASVFGSFQTGIVGPALQFDDATDF